MRRGAAALAPVACALALGACGGSSGPSPVAATTASRLRSEVHAVQSAVDHRSRAGALRGVGRLRGTITQLARTGALSGTDADSLLAVVARLDGQIDATVPAAATTTTPAAPDTTTPATTTPAGPQPKAPVTPKHPGHPGPPPGHGHGVGGHGHGHGKGGGAGGGD